MSVLEQERLITADAILTYLPETSRSRLPVRVNTGDDGFDQGDAGRNEKEMLYKVLFDMKSELDDLKNVVMGIIEKGGVSAEEAAVVKRVLNAEENAQFDEGANFPMTISNVPVVHSGQTTSSEPIEIAPSLSLIDSEKELIKKALEKHGNKRKLAATELGISERTLYRKIKEYDLN